MGKSVHVGLSVLVGPRWMVGSSRIFGYLGSDPSFLYPTPTWPLLHITLTWPTPLLPTTRFLYLIHYLKIFSYHQHSAILHLAAHSLSQQMAYKFVEFCRGRFHHVYQTPLARWRSVPFQRRCNLSISGADPGIYFGGKPNFPIESWGRSPNRGCEVSENRGRSLSRRREAPENWGRSPNQGRSPRKNGGGVMGRGLGAWASPQKMFEKSNLKPFILVDIWGKHLK